MDTYIIKIGSRLITKGDGKLNIEVISNLVEDIVRVVKTGKRIAIVSSGAVASGRTVKELQGDFFVENISEGEKIMREQMLAAVGQPELMAVYKAEFKKLGFSCAQVLVTLDDFSAEHRYRNLKAVTENLLSLGIVPIFNENDVLSTEELAFSDNDQLSSMAAAMLKAEKLIILTNVDGVYDKNPNDKDAKLLSCVENVEAILINVDESKNEVGRGGMKSKLIIAEKAISLGIGVHIANGFEKEIISRIILKGEKLGTEFRAKKEYAVFKEAFNL